MRTFIYLFILVVTVFAGSTLAQNRFAFLYSSTGMEYGKASAVDKDNCYINGSLFQNSINADPFGVFTLNAGGATTQIALTKYNAQGRLLWAKSFGGVNTSEAPHGIGTDVQKNIYVTGYFGNTQTGGPQQANFNPAGGGTLSTQGDEDCFLAKYDSNGNYLWALGLGNTGANTQERAWDIAVDSTGNSYVTGGFHGSINFNPLGEARILTLPDTSAGMFLAKYSPAGICLWVAVINTQCTSVFNEAYGTLDFDNAGNIVFACNFRGANVNFNPLGTAVPFSSSGLTDIFIGKYSPATGQIIWGRKIGSAAGDLVSPGALRCDANGNAYFTGRFSGTNSVDVNPGAGVNTIANSSLYIVSLDTAGNYRCSAGMNSGAGDGGHRISFDSEGNVYAAGWMNGTASFGSIQRTANSTTADVWIARYDNLLTACSWAFNFGGSGSSANSICAGLSVDKQNNVLITGQLYGSNADIDPSGNVFSLSSAGNNDCFLIKYTPAGSLWSDTQTGIEYRAPENKQPFVYPQPASTVLSIPFVMPESIYRIYSVTGQLVLTGSGKTADITPLSPGIYILEVLTAGKREMRKITVYR